MERSGSKAVRSLSGGDRNRDANSALHMAVIYHMGMDERSKAKMARCTTDDLQAGDGGTSARLL